MYSPFLASSRLVPCFLCQKGADTKLLPCGHVIMCSDCAGRAKRCPDCRVGPIFNLVLLLPAVNTLLDIDELFLCILQAVVQSFVATCVLCHQEQVSHTITPCGHSYCSSKYIHADDIRKCFHFVHEYFYWNRVASMIVILSPFRLWCSNHKLCCLPDAQQN